MPDWRRKRYLIVNADDFGQSPGINRGVIEAHERGIVTSASLMVRWPAAVEAARYARRERSLAVGLHLDFGEWICRRGDWGQLYSVLEEDSVRAYEAEASRQLHLFRELTGTEPTHLDSHQHAHRGRHVRALFAGMAAKLGVPLRSESATVRYYGGFYGQTSDGHPLPGLIGAKALLKTLSALPPGYTELGCHPAREIDMDSMYRGERLRELQALCDARVRETVVALSIELCSFREVPREALAARRASGGA